MPAIDIQKNNLTVEWFVLFLSRLHRPAAVSTTTRFVSLPSEHYCYLSFASLSILSSLCHRTSLSAFVPSALQSSRVPARQLWPLSVPALWPTLLSVPRWSCDVTRGVNVSQISYVKSEQQWTLRLFIANKYRT